MKKQLINTFILLGLICSQNLLAMTPQEYQEMIDSYKLEEHSNKVILNSIPLNYENYENLLSSNNFKDSAMFYGLANLFKINSKNIIQRIYTNFNTGEIYQDMTYPSGGSHAEFEIENADIYDQKVYSVACVSKDEKMIFSSILKSSTKNKKILFQGLDGINAAYYEQYKEYISNYFELNLIENNTSLSIDKPYEENKTFPYFNEQRILARLYETGTCDKEATQKANIEVLIGDKWIPQEQSWNIKKDEISNNINSSSQKPSLTLNQLLENAKSNKEVSLENISKVLRDEPLTTKNVQKYNDIAYYLQQANANDEAIFILEKIIDKFPNRTVAYLNLGDAHAGNHANENVNEDGQAKVNYEKYIEFMKKDNKEAKIPKRVLEFK